MSDGKANDKQSRDRTADDALVWTLNTEYYVQTLEAEFECQSASLKIVALTLFSVS